MAETLFYDLSSISKIGVEISIFLDIHSYRMVLGIPRIFDYDVQKDDSNSF